MIQKSAYLDGYLAGLQKEATSASGVVRGARKPPIQVDAKVLQPKALPAAPAAAAETPAANGGFLKKHGPALLTGAAAAELAHTGTAGKPTSEGAAPATTAPAAAAGAVPKAPEDKGIMSQVQEWWAGLDEQTKKSIILGGGGLALGGLAGGALGGGKGAMMGAGLGLLAGAGGGQYYYDPKRVAARADQKVKDDTKAAAEAQREKAVAWTQHNQQNRAQV